MDDNLQWLFSCNEMIGGTKKSLTFRFRIEAVVVPHQVMQIFYQPKNNSWQGPHHFRLTLSLIWYVTTKCKFIVKILDAGRCPL